MSNMNDLDELIRLAMELQSIAQNGLAYTRDAFDKERFERVREISAQIMAMKTELPLEKIKDVFCGEYGYQTPKLDTRAAVFQDGKILLVKEQGGWSLPGGWCDYNQSPASNTVKEAREEAGLDVVPVKVIAIQDRNKHNFPQYANPICKIFFQCDVLGGSFQENLETTESAFFSPDELPALNGDKNTLEQVKMCFDAASDPDWKTVFN